MRIPIGAGVVLLIRWATATAQIPQQPPTVTGTKDLKPTISTATPATVALRAGGTAQTVVLEGSWLDGLAVAYVERSGSKVSVRAELLPPTLNTGRREVRLTAPTDAGPPWGVPLDLLVARSDGLDPIRAPVQISVTGVLRISQDDLFKTTIDPVLAAANTTFNSCGDSDSDRRFVVNLPFVPYSAEGSVPRLELATSIPERAAFLLSHSLNPNDPFAIGALLSLGSGHPSPIPHTVTAVRMCMFAPSLASWRFASAAQTGVGPSVTVNVKFQLALFRARGMPADPTGTISGMTVGILWGNDITDKELPDRDFGGAEYDARLPLQVYKDGRISYGSPQVTRSSSGPRWTGNFLGPDGVRQTLERFATERMEQITQGIRTAVEATGTRNAISSAIMSKLQSKHGITHVVDLQRSSDGMWEVGYR